MFGRRTVDDLADQVARTRHSTYTSDPIAKFVIRTATDEQLLWMHDDMKSRERARAAVTETLHDISRGLFLHTEIRREIVRRFRSRAGGPNAEPPAEDR